MGTNIMPMSQRRKLRLREATQLPNTEDFVQIWRHMVGSTYIGRVWYMLAVIIIVLEHPQGSLK